MTTTAITTTPADFTAANRAFFDDLAARYDIKPWQKHMSLKITTYIQQNLDFIGIPLPLSKNPSKDDDDDDDDTPRPLTTTLLDYACGTGMISRALGPSVTDIQALDLSAKMVERYNELAASSEIASVKKARARVGNILTTNSDSSSSSSDDESLNGAEFWNFDIAAVGGGLHHFDDPAEAIRRLAERLRDGGVLLIVDFVEEEAGHGGMHGRMH